MTGSSKIIDLRNLLAQRFPQSFTPRAAHLGTGISVLDEATGGLPKGAITELTSSHPSAGSAALICALLHAAHRDHYFIALVDGHDSFDPESAGHAPLSNLLWIRCRRGLEAIKAADLLLRDGNFPLLILDLILNPAAELRKIPQTNWYRLQRLVEPSSTALLVLTRQSMIGSAQIKLVLENRWNLADLERQDHARRLAIRAHRLHRSRAHLTESG
ncbi:MAG: hypothetical protein ACJ8KU_11430 [Chthoniobacterales bacterium]